MLTRSKIKMEDSYKEIHQNLPYFTQQETYAYKSSKQVPSNKSIQHQAGTIQQQTKYLPYRTDFAEEQTRPNAARNQILKELRQEYEILRNLSIEESTHIPLKKYEAQRIKYDQRQSDLSSSMHSKESKNRDVRTPKQGNRQVQTLHLEKKQLELVIGNSMRKIEQLLNNEITLKKTIHELKSQIDGKGGISLEYEKTIRGLQKNEEELQAELARIKHQNEKSSQKNRELIEKIKSLEAELQKKERQNKQCFEQQRRLHEMMRIQKDKYLNLQIQCRSYKMEFEMLQKEKNNEINRLIRQFQSKDNGNEKEMAYIIKKLQEEVKEKDRRYHELLIEREKRKERESQVIQLEKKTGDKNYLEELLYKSRELSETNNKAFTDGMNMIFAKMSELQKRNDQVLKKEIQHLRTKSQREQASQMDQINRLKELHETNQISQKNQFNQFNQLNEVNKRKENEDYSKDLLSRIAELERMIQRQNGEKMKLINDLKALNQIKLEIEQTNRQLERRVKDLTQRENDFSKQNKQLTNHLTKQLEEIQKNYKITLNDYNNLKAENAVYIQRLRQFEKTHQGQRQIIDSHTVGFREKEKKLEEQIRALKRRIDEAQFQAEKNKKQGEFNLNIYRTAQESEGKRLLGQVSRMGLKLKETEEALARVSRQFQGKMKQKDLQLTEQRNLVQSMRVKMQEDLINQKKVYEEKITIIETRHTNEMKLFSEKFLSVSAANEKLIMQLTQMGGLESEVFELRRMLRSCRSTSAGVDHLWEVKETEYQNVIQVLKSLQQHS